MIYLISLGVIFFDQLTKLMVLEALTPHLPVVVFPSFNLFLTFNRGVSFSFLSGNHVWTPWALSALALVICLFIVRWMRVEKSRLILVGLSLILGGAIGNVIDRVRFGAVVDFLDFYIGSYHWPAFNVADSAICIGVGLILLDYLRKGKTNENN